MNIVTPGLEAVLHDTDTAREARAGDTFDVGEISVLDVGEISVRVAAATHAIPTQALILLCVRAEKDANPDRSDTLTV